MSATRPMILVERREPPVSTNERRFWLELYIPERVEAHPLKDKQRGYALGLYMGGGQFRLQGQKTFTTEHVRSWRRLADASEPVTQELPDYGQKARIHADRGSQETRSSRAQESPG